MRVLLINPPYQTLTSNLGVGHQVPLGLLMVGGALLSQGHEVRLIDAECGHLTLKQIVRDARRWRAEVVMTGHAGSTPAHPICLKLLRAIKAECERAIMVYGGVFPSYQAVEILQAEPAADFVVRGDRPPLRGEPHHRAVRQKSSSIHRPPPWAIGLSV